MKFKKTIWFVLLCVSVFILFSCLRAHEINFPADSSSFVGTWVLSSAPKGLKDRFQNGLPSSTLILQTNGRAIYSVPIDSNHTAGGGPSVPSDWYFSAGEGAWSFMDWGHKGWHIWRVDLQTDKIGIQFTLKRELSGKTILVYVPDPNSDEAVVFSRSQK